MRRVLVPTLLLWPLLAHGGGAGPAPVLGGTDAPAGKWPEVAATLDPDGFHECTGTLIAPNVVLTAAHCIDETFHSPASVLVGTNSLARESDGETIAVERRVKYPNGLRTYDVGVLVLAKESRFTPRAIATGWARFDIQNGAPVALVGYGAIDRNGTQYIDELQEAMTTITDAGCTTSAGCNDLAKPDGELGAGGMGIDTCSGDSGGPLYLVTDHGTYLAGVTSRGYADNQFYCSEGGIYTRPDKVIDWIEENAGVPVARGPEPWVLPLVAVRGHVAEGVIDANDPRSERHTFTITTPPQHGTAAIRDDGRVRVCTDPAYTGADEMTVTVTDASDPKRNVTLVVPIAVEDVEVGEDGEVGEPGADCDPEDFGDDVGGCCDAGRGASGSGLLALGVLVALRRRRRSS